MADDGHFLTDIGLVLRRAELRPVYAVATERRRADRGEQRPHDIVDMRLVGGADNLGQAVIVRLLTPRGELAALAHPEYGSRLHELVGKPNTATTRNLVKLYILESLQAESRIEEVVLVKVEPHAKILSLIEVYLQVKPIAQTRIVTIGPFTLEL